MKRSRFTEEQIIAILKQQESGVATADVCREHGISFALTFQGFPFDQRHRFPWAEEVDDLGHLRIPEHPVGPVKRFGSGDSGDGSRTYAWPRLYACDCPRSGHGRQPAGLRGKSRRSGRWSGPRGSSSEAYAGPSSNAFRPRHAEPYFHRQAGLDGGVTAGGLPTPLAGRLGLPRHLGIGPDRQRVPALQRFVIGPPVRDLVGRGGWSAHALQRGICATYVTAPCARGSFGAGSGASSGADMCPASVAAICMPRARMEFAGRVQIKAACSKALCCTLVLPTLSPDRCAKLLLALFRSDVLSTDDRLTPPRPETGRRRLKP